MTKSRIIFISLIVFGLILPILVYAALVPCGRRCCQWGDGIEYSKNYCVEPCDPENVSEDEAQPCTLCDIFLMLQTIVNYIWWALLIIAPLFIIAGGIMILTAGVKPDQLERGKQIITGTIIGLGIAFLSWTILNMVFLTLAKEQGEQGAFPWPWNRIDCTGGEIRDQEEEEEELIGSNNRYCHLEIADSGDYMYREYSTAEDCYAECPSRCTTLFNCEASCCLSINRGNQENPCGWGATDPGWCRRTVPVNALSWTLSSYPDPRQRGDASVQLSQFLDCMFLRVPNLQINSISSNVLCQDPDCDTSTPSCGHAANSCHFGGANSACGDFSYAVDFNTNVACQTIASAAKDCDSNSWFNYEVNHVHISVGYGHNNCNCNEGIYGVECP